MNINPQSNTDFTQVTCTVHFYYTRSDTRLCQILDQEPKTFPGTRSSSSGTKLSTLIVSRPSQKLITAEFLTISELLDDRDHLNITTNFNYLLLLFQIKFFSQKI